MTARVEQKSQQRNTEKNIEMCIGLLPVVLPAHTKGCSSVNNALDARDSECIINNNSSNNNKVGKRMIASRKRPRPHRQSILRVSSPCPQMISDNDSDTNNSSNKKCHCISSPSPSRSSSFTDACANSSGASSIHRSLHVQRNRVTFNDVVTSHSYLYSLTDKDKEDLWYGLPECARMNETVKRQVQEYRSANIDKVRHLLCVSSQCSYSRPNTIYFDTVRLRLPDECHGLERGLLPHSHRQTQQEHVRKVVEAQQMMKDWYKIGQEKQQQQLDSSAEEEKKADDENSMGAENKGDGERIAVPDQGSMKKCSDSKIGERAERKQHKAVSKSFRSFVGRKVDIVLAARARKSSQSSRLFAQLLGREVATCVKSDTQEIE